LTAKSLLQFLVGKLDLEVLAGLEFPWMALVVQVGLEHQEHQLGTTCPGGPRSVTAAVSTAPVKELSALAALATFLAAAGRVA